MPTYEYYCNRCNDIVDIFLRSLIKKPKVACPKCGNANIRRAWKTPPSIETDSTGGGYPYFSQNLGDKQHPRGQMVHSREHRKELMKKQGLEEF